MIKKRIHERDVKAKVMLAVGALPGVTLFNNPVGLAKLGSGHVVRYGLAVGSSDLIGWKAIEVTPDMVGQKLAVFVAIETKAPKGGLRREQQNFISTVLKAGGYAGQAKSSEDALSIIGEGLL